MLTTAEAVARIERRTSVWNNALAAGLKEAGRERARGRRAAREAADARALVARIVAEREAREAAETGPALYGDNPARICPALGMLAAWMGQDARGTVTADPEAFAARLMGLADLVADLARIAHALDLGGYEDAAELQARATVPAVALNRALPMLRAFADLLAARSYQARRGCDRVAAAVRQGARCGPALDAQNFGAEVGRLCAAVTEAGRVVLLTRGAQQALRQDVRNAVGAFLGAHFDNRR